MVRQHENPAEFLCSKCGNIKPASEFKNSVRPRKDKSCKSCVAERKRVQARKYRKADPQKNRDKAKAYYYRNLETCRTTGKLRARKCRETEPRYVLLRGARQRAREKGIAFSIVLEDIVIPKLCPVLGLELRNRKKGDPDWDHAASLDRVDNTKGYIKGNIAVISRRANRLKSDGTVQEHEQILAWMR